MEESALLFVQEHIRQGWLNRIVVFITKLGDVGFFWIALTLVLFCIAKTRKTGIMCLTSIGIIHIVNNLIIKNLVGRVRPYDAIRELQALVPPLRDSSFPSGHSACSFAVAVVVFRNLPKKIGVPVLVLAFLISLSRIYVGVHYPTDVVCGAIFGTLSALAAEFIVKHFAKKMESKKSGGEN